MDYSITKRSDKANTRMLALFGCALITLGSLVKVPFFPVPFTLQTMAVFILALTQSPKQAALSCIAYLAAATIGLPVLCGNSKPLWIAGKCGGYLVAFPLAAYAVSYLRAITSPILALTVGQCIIYFLGWCWLAPLFSAKAAFINGVLFFIPSDIVKNLFALRISALWNARKSS